MRSWLCRVFVSVARPVCAAALCVAALGCGGDEFQGGEADGGGAGGAAAGQGGAAGKAQGGKGGSGGQGASGGAGKAGGGSAQAGGASGQGPAGAGGAQAGSAGKGGAGQGSEAGAGGGAGESQGGEAGASGSGEGGSAQAGGGGSAGSAGCAEPTVYYKDFDHDGHGDFTKPLKACDEPPSTGEYGWSAMGDDCNDGNTDVFPGQTKFFAEPYATGPQSSSFDYDCDGQEQGPNSSPLQPNCAGLIIDTCSGKQGYVPNGPGKNGYCGSTSYMLCYFATFVCKSKVQAASEPYRCR